MVFQFHNLVYTQIVDYWFDIEKFSGNVTPTWKHCS